MAKYIDIDVAKEAARRAECDADYDGRRFDAECVENALDFIPAADVRKVDYAEWVVLNFSTLHVEALCSICGHRKTFSDIRDFSNYCPNCGADMKAKSNENQRIEVEGRPCNG